MQSGNPSLSESVSGTPQPQRPGMVLAESSGQRSWLSQLGVPSGLLPISTTPHPQRPGVTFSGSFGQRS